MDPDDGSLLRQFVTKRDQGAFAELVRRHIDMVYAAARRQSDDAAGAEDVTQAVFILLAQRGARTIRDGRALPGWLLVTTRYAALNARRTEARRRHHETVAAMHKSNGPESSLHEWESIRPELDGAVARLKPTDRDAITLRFFKGQRMCDVAAALGVSEPAAQKRVGRAVERLRGLLKRAGVTGRSEALAAILSANLLSSTAPAHLSAQVTSVATAASAAAGATAGISTAGKGFILLMATTKTKLAIAAVAVVAFAAVTIPVAHHFSRRVANAQSAPPADPEARFQAHYALAAGQNVKRVPLPFIPERDDMLENLRGHRFEHPPAAMIFEFDGTAVSWKHATQDAPMNLGDAMKHVLDVWPQDTDVPRRRLAEPVEGDWIYRAGTSRDDRMKDFCREAAGVIGGNMILKLESVEREAIVVSGTIDFEKTKAHGADQIGNQITFVPEGPPEQSHHTVGQTPREMLQILGEMMGRPVVIEPGTKVDEPKQPFFISTYASGDFGRKVEVPGAATVDPILARVAEQTGLELKRQRAMVPTWRLVDR